MLDTIQNEIRRCVAAELGDEAGAAIDISPVPADKQGDLSVVAFPLARLLRKNPKQLADALTEPLKALDFVSSVEPVGAYINLSLDRTVVGKRLQKLVASGDLYRFEDGKGRRVLLEHTSINPNASPHIGRCRNGIIGDTLARVMRKLGFDVEVHYYVNNMGKQIALLARACRGLAKEPTFDEILQIYIDASQQAEGNDSVEQETFQMLQAFEEGDAAMRDEFRRVVGLCLKGQTEILGRLGIRYDTFDEESDYIRSDRLDAIIRSLESTGALFTDKDGRGVVDLEKLGFKKEHGRHLVMRRSNGSSMYVLRDLAYTCHKADLGAEINLTVLGEDHRLYQEQLEWIVRETVGCQTPDAIFYSFVLLKEGKMSTRKGTLVLLSDLLDQAEKRALEKIIETRPELDASAHEKLSRQIARAAIRFSLSKVAPASNISFDIEESLAFEGDTGPYVQYTYARLRSVLERAAEKGGAMPPDWSLTADGEWDVLMELGRFRDRIRETHEARSPATLCSYALALARVTNRFYHGSPVIQAEPELFGLRTQICRMVATTLAEVLDLMGIAAPERI